MRIFRMSLCHAVDAISIYALTSTKLAARQPTVTLQQAISLVLAPENTIQAVPPSKIYSTYRKREHFGFRLWNQEKRKKRNNW